MNARRLTIVARLALAAYALQGVFFVFSGRVNGDEGWYWNAARVVYQGQLPYLDFAFPQMPLMPYAYGLAYLISPSLYAARLLSLAFAFAAVWMYVRLARRLAGPGAGAAVAVLVAACPMTIYLSVLVKTYAIVSFFLAATLTALCASERREWSTPVAVAASIALTLTRTAGAPIALLVTGYGLLRAPSPAARLRCLALAVVGAGIGGFFLLAEPAASAYLLRDLHQTYWFDTPLADRIRVILVKRIPAWLGSYPGYAALAAGALVVAARNAAARAFLRTTPALAILALGGALFLASHLLPGQFGPVEYPTPVLPLLVTVSAILLAHGAPTLARLPGRAAAGVAILAAASLVHPSVAFYTTPPGEPGSIGALGVLARFVARHTAPDDEVLALWHQDVVVIADRASPPDVGMGLFSYFDLDDEHARLFHFVNARDLAKLIGSRRPAAVVFGEFDRKMFERAGSVSKHASDPEPILAALSAHYEVGFSATAQGIRDPEQVDVYLRRPAPPR